MYVTEPRHTVNVMTQVEQSEIDPSEQENGVEELDEAGLEQVVGGMVSNPLHKGTPTPDNP